MHVIDNLVAQSVAPNTLQTYKRGLSTFNEFRFDNSLPVIWPVPLNDILQFIVFLVQSNLAHSSISCYLAGISFFGKINDFEDILQKIIVKKVLEGIKRYKGHMQDQRLPITLDLLTKVIGILPIVCASKYETVLFGATFFFSIFRFIKNIRIRN